MELIGTYVPIGIEGRIARNPAGCYQKPLSLSQDKVRVATYLANASA
jgi:hypothetical protein